MEIIPDNDDSLITEILPRRNSFIRPFVANVDCFAVVTAVAKPAPLFSVIDKFLVMAERSETEVILCVSKCDLAEKRKVQQTLDLIKEIYTPIYPVVCLGRDDRDGVDEFRKLAAGKKVALAGPSGVGKSTLLNRLIPEAEAETGGISEKSGRGKHTTRHSELFTIDEEAGTMIFDTPGFTSFDILEADEDELQHYYPEMEKYIGSCKYNNCRHISEPGCQVLEALAQGQIHDSRYQSYKTQLEEIKKSNQH
jgi:ribosome biogenesis GTPase